MVGTRSFATIVHAAADAQAKVVLVGDPRQLPEIDAGGVPARPLPPSRPDHADHAHREPPPGRRVGPPGRVPTPRRRCRTPPSTPTRPTAGSSPPTPTGIQLRRRLRAPREPRTLPTASSAAGNPLGLGGESPGVGRLQGVSSRQKKYRVRELVHRFLQLADMGGQLVDGVERVIVHRGNVQRLSPTSKGRSRMCHLGATSAPSGCAMHLSRTRGASS
jgi:hypothetical protein